MILVRAAIDALDAAVAVHAADRILVHEAIAAKQLQAAIDDLAFKIGGPVLRHRSGRRIELALQVLPDAVVHEHACHGRLCLALGQHELRVLEVHDGFPERLALLHIVDGQLQRALDCGDGLHRDC